MPPEVKTPSIQRLEVLQVVKSRPPHRSTLRPHCLHESLGREAAQLLGMVDEHETAVKLHTLGLGIRMRRFQTGQVSQRIKDPPPIRRALFDALVKGLQRDLGDRQGQRMRPPFQSQDLGLKHAIGWVGQLLLDARPMQVAVDQLALVQLPMIGGDRSSLASVDRFAVRGAPLETKARNVAHAADLDAIPFCSVGVSRVLDDGHTVPPADVYERVHVAGVPPVMDGHDGPGAPGDPPFGILGVDEQGLGIDLAEHGPGSHVQCPAIGAQVAHRGNDDLIAWPDSNSVKGAGQGRRTMVHRQAIVRPDIVPELLFKLFGQSPAGARERTRFHQLSDEGHLPFDRALPLLWVLDRHSWLSTQDRQSVCHSLLLSPLPRWMLA